MPDYRISSRIKQLSPEIIRNWNEPKMGDVYEVKRRMVVTCPKTDEVIPESNCMSCPHYFGRASEKWNYCLPDTIKKIGARITRRKERREDTP